MVEMLDDVHGTADESREVIAVINRVQKWVMSDIRVEQKKKRSTFRRQLKDEAVSGLCLRQTAGSHQQCDKV